MTRPWYESGKSWAWIGGGLMLLGLMGRRVYSRVASGLDVTIDRTGLAHGHGRSYYITANDRLWLGRALLGEVNESASSWTSSYTRVGGTAVLWALIQGYLLRGYRNYSTLASYARGYCQPINPRWMTAGQSKCAQYPQYCTPSHLSRRARISAATAPPALRTLVDSWSRGEVGNPVPGLTDWHANQWAGSAINIAGNWFGARS